MRKNVAAKVIDRLGGPQAIARLTGWPASTVYDMRRNGRITDWRKHELLELSAKLGDPLTPADFFTIAENSPVPPADVSHDAPSGVRVSDHLGDRYGMGDDAPVRALLPGAASTAAE